MGLQLTARIEGDKELSRELGIMVTKIKDFREPLRKIGNEVEKSYQTNFDTRGSLYGGWAKRKGNKPWPLMEKTGALRRGYQSDFQGQDTLVISNRLMDEYGKYHQSKAPRSKLPRRVILKLDAERKEFAVKAFQQFVHDTLRGK